MLHEPTPTKLQAMKHTGMAEARGEKRAQPRIAELSVDERFGLLIERQWRGRENRAVATRLSRARLKQPAGIEDLNLNGPRGLKRSIIEQLRPCDRAAHPQNLIITSHTSRVLNPSVATAMQTTRPANSYDNNARHANGKNAGRCGGRRHT